MGISDAIFAYNMKKHYFVIHKNIIIGQNEQSHSIIKYENKEKQNYKVKKNILVVKVLEHDIVNMLKSE